MPKYDYSCNDCGIITIEKSMSAPHPEKCGCGGALTRHYSPVGVLFNGPGFYKTDSRKGS